MAGYIYVPLLLSILVTLGFVLSGGLILSGESPPVDEITERYTLVDKEANPSNSTLQLSTLEFTSQTLPADPINQVCSNSEYDIAFVIDTSGTIGSDELKYAQQAIIAFIKTFFGSSTKFSVTSFDYYATTSLGLTNNNNYYQDVIDSINNIKRNGPPSNTGNGPRGNTNWQDGLSEAYKALNSINNQTSSPDFVIFASDGKPNRIGIKNDNRVVSEEKALDAAIFVADIIKENGTRIVAFNIGDNSIVENLQKIAGSDVVTTTLINLKESLQIFAADICEI